MIRSEVDYFLTLLTAVDDELHVKLLGCGLVGVFCTLFLLFCYHRTRSRHVVCKQLCKLPYHSCVLPDDDFLNKPKHVVTILSNKRNFSVC